MIETKKVCKDYGEPGCLEEVDERFTMNFDDIGEEPVYWCSNCGQRAKELEALLLFAVMEKGFDKVEKLINDAYEKQVKDRQDKAN